MPKQPAFPGLRDAMKEKRTRREKVLAEMEAVVPWRRLLGLVEPHYPKTGAKGGRPPMLLETMLRVYFLQQWYALSDPMAEEMLYDSDAMRRFAGIELGDDRIPDETTILDFRHLLERHGLTEAILADVNAHLADKGITLCSGTLVDATIIDAPSSTRNTARALDPEMSSTKKGNEWYFGSEEDQKSIRGGLLKKILAADSIGPAMLEGRACWVGRNVISWSFSLRGRCGISCPTTMFLSVSIGYSI